jgi:hypothetical protein
LDADAVFLVRSTIPHWIVGSGITLFPAPSGVRRKILSLVFSQTSVSVLVMGDLGSGLRSCEWCHGVLETGVPRWQPPCRNVWTSVCLQWDNDMDILTKGI